MRKLALLLVLVLMFSLSAVASANIEIGGGLTFDTFAGKVIGANDEDLFEYDEWKNGHGYYGEGIYWLNEKMGIGFRYEMIEAKREEFEENIKVFTPYGTLNYKINPSLTLKAGIGYNNLKFYDYEYVDKVPALKGNSVGGFIGGTFKYQIKENINLAVTGFYRYCRPEIEEKYDLYDEIYIPYGFDHRFDMSGFSIGAGVTFEF